jgi:hypothetical protein
MASKAAFIAMASRIPKKVPPKFQHVATQHKVVRSSADSDSDESEEDPDDEEMTETYLNAQRNVEAKTQDEKEVDGQELEAESTAALEAESQHDMETAASHTAALNPEDYSTQIEEPLADMTESFGGDHINFSQANTSLPEYSSTQPQTTSSQPDGRAEIYIVKRVQTVDDGSEVEETRELGKFVDLKRVQTVDGSEVGETRELGKFVDREQANAFAKEQVQAHRKAHGEPRHIDDNLESNLYFCKLNHNNYNATIFHVVTDNIPKSKLPASTTIEGPKQAWMIHLTITTVIYDKVKDREREKERMTILPEQYSDLGRANYAAAKYLYEYLKPKQPKLEFFTRHENEIGPELRKERDECSDMGKEFEHGFEVGELKWAMSEGVKVAVVAHTIR